MAWSAFWSCGETTKTNLGGEQGLTYRLRLRLRQDPGAGAVGNTAYWLASVLTFSFLFLHNQDHLSRSSPAHSGLDPPTSLKNQDYATQPTADLIGAIPQLRFFPVSSN